MEVKNYPNSIQYTEKSVLIVLEIFANHLLEGSTFNVNHFDVIDACTRAAYGKVDEPLSDIEVCTVSAFLTRFHVCI